MSCCLCPDWAGLIDNGPGLQDSDLIAKHQVRVNVVGQLHLLPSGVQAAAEEVVQASKQYQGWSSTSAWPTRESQYPAWSPHCLQVPFEST